MKLDNLQNWELNGIIKYSADELNVHPRALYTMFTKIIEAKSNGQKILAIKYLMNQLVEAKSKVEA